MPRPRAVPVRTVVASWRRRETVVRCRERYPTLCGETAKGGAPGSVTVFVVIRRIVVSRARA